MKIFNFAKRKIYLNFNAFNILTLYTIYKTSKRKKDTGLSLFTIFKLSLITGIFYFAFKKNLHLFIFYTYIQPIFEWTNANQSQTSLLLAIVLPVVVPIFYEVIRDAIRRKRQLPDVLLYLYAEHFEGDNYKIVVEIINKKSVSYPKVGLKVSVNKKEFQANPNLKTFTFTAYEEARHLLQYGWHIGHAFDVNLQPINERLRFDLGMIPKDKLVLQGFEVILVLTSSNRNKRFRFTGDLLNGDFLLKQKFYLSLLRV